MRKSVKAIGQTAVKIDSAAERCVNVLLELIATRVSYVVQEAVVVMKVGVLCRWKIDVVNLRLILGHFPQISFDVRRDHPHSLL